MTYENLDLFDEPKPSATRHKPVAPQRMAASICATGTGQPPEWGLHALEVVFAERKLYRKAHITPPVGADLIRAMWDYSLARHEALLEKRPASAAAQSLSGHRNLCDKLAQALRVIDRHGVDVSMIPAAKEFGTALDLRHLAGESPFPIADGEPPSEGGIS